MCVKARLVHGIDEMPSKSPTLLTVELSNVMRCRPVLLHVRYVFRISDTLAANKIKAILDFSLQIKPELTPRNTRQLLFSKP